MPIKFIQPAPIKLAEVTAAIDFGLQVSGEIVKAEFALFTGTWETKNQPQWKEKKAGSTSRLVDLGALTGDVKIVDRVWAYTTESTPMTWVDDGTKPHKIRSKKFGPGGGFLHFQPGFVAKTKPGQIMSGPGAHFGPFVFAKEVDHPGTDPRFISDEIAKNADGHLARSIDDALNSKAPSL